MEKNVSEEKLQVFSLLIDGPFIFSMDKRLIYQNNYIILIAMMKTLIANFVLTFFTHPLLMARRLIMLLLR